MLSQTLTAILSALPALLPELVLTGAFVLVLVLDLIRGRVARLLMPLVALAAFAAYMALAVWHRPELPANGLLMHGMLRLDGITRYASLLMGAAGLLTLVLAHFYRPLKTRTQGLGEFVALVLAMVLGLGLMVKAGHLLLLYLSIEVVSISSYVLTVLLRERKHSAEAGLKYVLFGAMASGVMIYGMSFLYGLSGSLTFADPEFGLRLEMAPNGLLVVGVVLTFIGLLFKAGAAPMHIWAPDVYQGAPTPVAALFSTAPKIAAVIVMARILPSLPGSIWAAFLLPLLSVVVLASLAAGNFGALRQVQVKRLLAFSSIAHIGFMMMPLLGRGAGAIEALLFYATVYMAANFGTFALLQVVEQEQEELQVNDFSGLGQTAPLLGVALVVQMIALTGLPPTGGFTAKLLVFSSVYEQLEALNSAWLLWVLVAGLLLTVVALFYYLRLPYVLYFKGNETNRKLVVQAGELAVICFLALLVLLFFFKADWLAEWIKWVVG